MRRSRLVGLAAVAMISGTLLSPATPAHADGTRLYVNNIDPEACSDTEGGSLELPFCTIGAAAAKAGPGQTIQVSGGPYAERVDVPVSGTADRPITIDGWASASGPRTLLQGPTAGFVIRGQRHVTIQGFQVYGELEAPAVDLHQASGVAVNGLMVRATAASTQPAFRLSAVTGFTGEHVIASGPGLANGLSLDSASSGVTITSAIFTNRNTEAGEGVGIDVASSDTRILETLVSGFRGAGIAVRSGAVHTVIANSQIDEGYGDGIQIRGATGTALSNNRVEKRCGNGVRVDGPSERISVQNNLVLRNGYGGPGATSLCESAPTDGVEIGVYGESRGKAVVDYNNTANSQRGYAWGAPMTLEQFRAASGQAAHDIRETTTFGRIDSANSAAPGFPARDFDGRGRGDDPSRANLGAGPVPWADRGPWETLAQPTVVASFKHEPGTGWVTVDASSTAPGFSPVASYRFDFGDGTVVTQAGPVARHQYRTHGTRTVSIQATLVDTMTGSRAYQVSFLPRAGTIGLLSPAHHRYVGVGRPSKPGAALHADHPTLTTAQAFDLVNVGTGQVALLSHATGGYLTLEHDGGYVVTGRAAAVGPNETFAMTRYSDGSFSLKASTGRYVSTYGSGGPLIPEASQVGLTEKFHRVNLADAGRSLRPAIRKQYVTADTAAAKPLTASGTTLGRNQRFDVVDLGSGKVALFAHANNRFVWTPNNGSLPLINSTGAVGPTATFTLVRNTDGTVSLKAAANNRYVTVGTSTTTPLTASRTSIGLTERFLLR
ncbi:right-handed parallel beta-helix repeat-containing protein [Micromonospora sp. NPDC126480]|uniref:right-handed parallel beta-helix repeat-containing protein n=1 Tax=Micromonospora sp. NPDC126480 TaxID=3155312 RepID=UPI00331FED8B